MNRILIVEGYNLALLKIIRTLEEDGFTNNIGIDSADLIIEQPYVYLKNVELIIMDTVLPGISGIEAAYWLKTNVAYAHIPIIFLSGSSDSVTVKKALEAGGINYLTQPYKEADLIKRVEKILGKPQNLPIDNFSAIEIDEAKKIISIEYNRSVRGQLPVTFIRMKVIKSNKQRIDKITETLRQIDQIFILSSGEIFLVLPLTDDSGSKRVVKKLEDWLNKEKIIIAKISTVTRLANGSQTLEELICDLLGSD